MAADYSKMWKKEGISLLWDAHELKALWQNEKRKIVSVRGFCRLEKSNWEAVPMMGKALVVAGLDACLDTLPTDEISEWLEEKIRPAIVNFQEEVADGGNQAALVFWFGDGKRVRFEEVGESGESAWKWRCAGKYRDDEIEIGKCLFGGAHGDLKEIFVANHDHTIGLYHPRIS